MQQQTSCHYGTACALDSMSYQAVLLITDQHLVPDPSHQMHTRRAVTYDGVLCIQQQQQQQHLQRETSCAF